MDVRLASDISNFAPMPILIVVETTEDKTFDNVAVPDGTEMPPLDFGLSAVIIAPSASVKVASFCRIIPAGISHFLPASTVMLLATTRLAGYALPTISQVDGTPKDKNYGKDGAYYAVAQKAVSSLDEYADALVSAGTPDGIDVISGATYLHDQAVEAAKKALKSAQ